MRFRLGLSIGERFSLSECVEQAVVCEEYGFDSIWVAEGRLTRDGIVPSATIAQATSRIRVGTGVINHKTRNAALTAVTFKTLDELAPGRINLGIGAWWEPLASRVGLPLVKPIQEMREYLYVVKALFRGETVDFEGDFVTMRGIRFDMMYRENEPVDIPVYIGAVRPRMLELSGEIADGVLLDFHVPPTYVEGAVKHVNTGLARRGDGVTEIDLPQLVTCSVDDDDPQGAIDDCKAFLTMYVAQQPHITKYSDVEPELIERIKEEMGWPARPEDVQRAMRLVSNELTQELTACGTTHEAMDQIERYLEAGTTCAVLCTLGKNKVETVHRIARAAR